MPRRVACRPICCSSRMLTSRERGGESKNSKTGRCQRRRAWRSGCQRQWCRQNSPCAGLSKARQGPCCAFFSSSAAPSFSASLESQCFKRAAVRRLAYSISHPFRQPIPRFSSLSSPVRPFGLFWVGEAFISLVFVRKGQARSLCARSGFLPCDA